MNLAQLRKDLPTWTWAPVRNGMGWTYEGTLGSRGVRVYAVAALCGPAEDDYETQWRVDNGRESQTYASFWLSERTL